MRANHDAERLLADLLAAGAIPVIEDDKLRIEAPRGVVSPARLEALSGCLPELKAIVATRWLPREACVARRPCRRMSACREPEPDGFPCLLPRTCAICKNALPLGRKYLCEACAEARMNGVSE